MRTVEFHIHNFMGIAEAHLSLDGKGLVLIQGENNDDPSAVSNGAGKSTVADAWFWCNYGETARDGLSADEVVNTKIGKNCHVITVFEEDDGTRHRIERWRKKTINGKRSGCSLVTTDPAGNEINLTGGKDSITQDAIDRAIGCSKQVALAAVYAGQEKLPNLPAMTDTELKTLIEQASGVDTLVRAYGIARKKLLEAENNLDVWRMNHIHAERSVTDANARLKDVSDRRDGYERSKKINLASFLASVKDEVEKAQLYKAQRDQVNVANVQAAIDRLDSKIASVNSELEEDARLQSLEINARAKVTSIKANYAKKADEARMQRARVDNIEARVGTPCGECGKPYCSEDLGHAKELATEKLRSLVAEAREIREDEKTFSDIASEHARKLTEHRAKKTDISATVDERQRLATALAGRRTAEASMLHHTEAAKRARENADRLKAEVNPFIEMLDKVAAELKDANATFHQSEIKGVECEKRVQVCKDVVKVYGPAGVRAHILDNVTPYLNDRTADYLGTLSDGLITAVWSTLSLNAKGELTERFAINVKKEGDGESFAALSGGEKRKVRLATALALQDLVATRATKPVGLWIGDEIDDALDDAGLERLMTILEQKARERGTVLVISHNSLNDWIRDTVTVTRKDKISTVEGCLVVA